MDTLCFRAHRLQSIPGTSLTLLGFCGRRRCPGRSVRRWTRGCVLSPACSKGKMAALCREFDISRQTGHKFYKRYKDLGLQGLTDRSRRPYRQANRLPERVESLIVQLRREHPSWGAPKIREKIKRLGLGVSLPAISTVHAVLDRHGLVGRGRRRHHFKAEGTGLSRPDQPNDLWCADYKGEFMLADHRYC